MSDDEVTVKECGPDCACQSDEFNTGGYVFNQEGYYRQEATRYAIDIIVAVNTTTAWVPQDTALFDMIYGFLKGQSVPDPGLPVTDG